MSKMARISGYKKAGQLSRPAVVCYVLISRSSWFLLERMMSSVSNFVISTTGGMYSAFIFRTPY